MDLWIFSKVCWGCGSGQTMVRWSRMLQDPVREWPMFFRSHGRYERCLLAIGGETHWYLDSTSQNDKVFRTWSSATFLGASFFLKGKESNQNSHDHLMVKCPCTWVVQLLINTSFASKSAIRIPPRSFDFRNFEWCLAGNVQWCQQEKVSHRCHTCPSNTVLMQQMHSKDLCEM